MRYFYCKEEMGVQDAETETKQLLLPPQMGFLMMQMLLFKHSSLSKGGKILLEMASVPLFSLFL